MPHTGTFVPEWLAPRLSPAGRPLPDTDWHLERLYDFLDDLGASVLVATHSRYVVDLNRPPDNANLYPGQDTTGVVPLDTFHREPLYVPGFPPSEEEVAARINTYWKPYHERLGRRSRTLKRATATPCSGTRIPSFPSCRASSRGSCQTSTSAPPAANHAAPESAKRCANRRGLQRRAERPLQGRLHHAPLRRPGERHPRRQLELSEATYMDEKAPYKFRDNLAKRLRPQLRTLLELYLSIGK